MCFLCIPLQPVLKFGSFPPDIYQRTWAHCPELLDDPVFVYQHVFLLLLCLLRLFPYCFSKNYTSFLNDLISSIFLFFLQNSLSLQLDSHPIILFSSLSFTLLHHANDFVFHSCPSMDCCPGIGGLLALIAGKNKSLLGLPLLESAGSEFSASQLTCVFVFHRNRDHKAERGPGEHVILWMSKLQPESQVTGPGPESISPNQAILALPG